MPDPLRPTGGSADPHTDPDADSDAAFTAALYSRIRPTSPTTVTPDTVLSSLGADEVAAEHWGLERNEHDHTLHDAPKGPVLPPAFVARVRDRLQRELREHDPSSASDALVVPSRLSVYASAGTIAIATAPTVPSTSFRGFLERLETDLAVQYDRVIQNDLPLLSPANRETTTPATKWCDTLHTHVPNTAAGVFRARYGTGLNEFCDLTTRLVADVVAGYRTYFEAEADVVAVAERYDALQTWAHQSKALFDAHADVAMAPGFDDVVAKCFGTDTDADDESRTADGVAAPDPWKARVARAKRAWLDVQAQRHVVDRLRAIVGTPCTCKVCFGEVVQTVLVPCGHTLCKECAKRVGQCPFCNATFYSTQEVYFG
jgi:hypothetical protein